MKIAVLVLAMVALATGALMAWVRLAPSDPARWHGTLTFTKDEDRAGGVIRILPAADPMALMQALDQIALNTPRTVKLAGSVAEGSITYVTRSLFWGFPDYTTVTATNGKLIVFGRLRFGQSDFGVNKARVDGWISQLPANAS